jgi:hypothetical protein
MFRPLPLQWPNTDRAIARIRRHLYEYLGTAIVARTPRDCVFPATTRVFLVSAIVQDGFSAACFETTTAGAVMNLSNRMNVFIAAAFMILFAEVLVAGRMSRAAENCINEPNAAAPEGSHWYYHVDRITQQKCWYLRPEGIKKDPRRQHATTAVRPPTPSPQPGVQPLAFPKPVGQPVAQTAAAPVATTTGEAKPAADGSTVVSAIETSGLGSPNQSTLVEALMPDSAPEILDATLEVRPITRPSNMATGEPASTFTFPSLVAIIAAVLGFVVIIARFILRLSAVRRLSRPKARDRFGRGSRLHRLDTEAPSKLGNAAGAQHTVRPKPASVQARDSVGEIEASVRQLLHELRQRQDHWRPIPTWSGAKPVSVDQPARLQRHRARYEESLGALRSL